MGWPQWVVIGLLIFNLGVSLAMDGKPRSPMSFMASAIGAVITWWLLWMGGFWGA
jgi:hypothetical protein